MLSTPGGMALVYRGENGDGHMHAGAVVTDRRPVEGRRPIRKTGDAHGAAHRLRNRFKAFHVCVRAKGTEPLDGGVNQARIDFLQILPAQTHPVQRAGAEVFQQHIGLRNDLFKMRFGFVRLQVQREAALVGIERKKKQFVVVLRA